jgi:RNA polymerase sigma-70 factor, ECF subfamily
VSEPRAAELMGRYCDGDARAFRDLYALTAPRLLRYLQRMASDRAAAEDLLQQVFLKVHRARSAYVRGADPIPWLYAIAHRTFLDEARRRKRARVSVARDPDATPEVPAHLSGKPAAEVEEDGGPEPALLAAALAALDDLPQNQKEAVVLVKISGKSILEAATIAGTTPGAMKLRAHRGYVALRKALVSEAGGAE